MQWMKAKHLTDNEMKESIKMYRETGEDHYAEDVISGCFAFIAGKAREMSGHGVPMSDMLAVGVEGLMHAVEKVDLSYENTFLTYADHWITRYMRREAKQFSSSMTVSSFAHERMKKLYSIENWEDYSDEELAEMVDCPVNTLRSIKACCRREAEIQECDYAHDVEEDFRNRLGDPVKEANDKDIIDSLTGALDGLTDRERNIIQMRYLDEPKLTLEQVGEKLGKCRERIRQIEAGALLKMRDNMKGVEICF